MMERDARQKLVLEWVKNTFGPATTGSHERALRLLEEAIELVQAEGITRSEVEAIIDHVFRKPPGKPEQEAGAVGVTLLAYCEARGFSADAAERIEYERVSKIDPSHFRARHNLKADAGIATRGIEEDSE